MDSLTICDFLSVSIPNYIETRLDKTAEELNRYNQKLEVCIQAFAKLYNDLNIITKKLKASFKLFVFTESVVVNMKKSIHEQLTNNLKEHEFHALLLFLYLLSVQSYYQAKKHKLNIDPKHNYHAIYSQDIRKKINYIIITSKINGTSDFKAILELIFSTLLTLNKSLLFVKYLYSLSSEFDLVEIQSLIRESRQELDRQFLLKAHRNKYLKSKNEQKQSTLKLNSNEKQSLKSFNSNTPTKESQKITQNGFINSKQDTKSEHSNFQLFQSADFDLRQSKKSVSANFSLVQIRRTIGQGINQRYKVESQKIQKILNPTNNDLSAKMKQEVKREAKLDSLCSGLDDSQKQLRFCEEVSQKLIKYKRKQPSIKKNIVACETPSE